jgi:hypothetical protein
LAKTQAKQLVGFFAPPAEQMKNEEQRGRVDRRFQLEKIIHGPQDAGTIAARSACAARIAATGKRPGTPNSSITLRGSIVHSLTAHRSTTLRSRFRPGRPGGRKRRRQP